MEGTLKTQTTYTSSLASDERRFEGDEFLLPSGFFRSAAVSSMSSSLSLRPSSTCARAALAAAASASSFASASARAAARSATALSRSTSASSLPQTFLTT